VGPLLGFAYRQTPFALKVFIISSTLTVTVSRDRTAEFESGLVWFGPAKLMVTPSFVTNEKRICPSADDSEIRVPMQFSVVTVLGISRLMISGISSWLQRPLSVMVCTAKGPPAASARAVIAVTASASASTVYLIGFPYYSNIPSPSGLRREA